MEFAVSSRSFLDPRTKLLLLLTLPVFLMGGAGGEYMQVFRMMFALLPFVLLVISKNYAAAAAGFSVYLLAEAARGLWLPGLSGGFYFNAFMMMYELCCVMLPCGLMALFVMRSTAAAEFIAGLERLKVPDFITIPAAVMLRFFPVVLEELRAAGRAMTMRGITLRRAGPAAFLEYRMVPVLFSIMKIGQELTQAALTRGLCPGVKRTCIRRLRFKWADYAALFFCALAYIVWLLSLFGIRFRIFTGDF